MKEDQITVKNNEDVIDGRCEVSEEIDQVTKSVIHGRQEVHYEDGRNVISVIINAISVRINMPRGTVKVLMACLAVLVVLAVIYASDVFHSWIPDAPAEEHAVEADEPVVEADEPAPVEESAAESNSVTSDDILALKDYVNISPHYYYHLPEDVADIWEPDEPFAENEIYCDFTYEGDPYTVCSYVLEYRDADLADIIKSGLSMYENIEFVDEEYVDGKYGKMLKIMFECLDDDNAPVAVTGYYWYESIPKICCLEVASDTWHDGKAEEMIIDSIYRVSAGTTAPYYVDESAWQDAAMEDAMSRMIQDAIREDNDPGPDHDFLY